MATSCSTIARTTTAAQVAAGLVICALVGACSSANDRADTVVLPTAEVQPTDTASELTTAALETSVAAPSTSTPATPTSTVVPATVATTLPTSEAPPAGSRDPEQIIITLADMPTGWSPSSEEEEEDDSEESLSCLDGVFGNDGEELIENQDVPTAEAVFEQSDFGPFVSTFVAVDVEGADTAFDGFGEAFAGCDGTTDPDGYTYTILPMSFPALGDDTFAVRIDADSEDGFPFSAYMVAARIDDVVMFLFGVAIMGPFDGALLEDLMTTMVDRAT